MSRQASGLAASISEFVRILTASSWAWDSRCASSMTRRREPAALAVLGGDQRRRPGRRARRSRGRAVRRAR